MFKKIISSPFFIFPLLTCVVFWPLSLQLFALKNDALTYYYPVRTLISDALNNHELPLWTPYINMGYPLHADMQSGAWNPIIWIFSFLTHYSLAAFHYELLFYLCFAGIGFYYLCKEYGWSRSTAFTIAIAYELSGFMIDGVQFFVCISAACYIPYIFIFFRRIFKTQQITDSIAAAFFLYLFLSGGYPSLFIITCYFLLAYAIFIFINIENKKTYLQKSVLPLALVAFTFILLSLPAIISYAQLIPHIERGKTQSLDFVLQNSMPPFSMLSLISPFSTTAKAAWLNTDPLMRNTYIGIIPLLFLCYAIFNKAIRKNKEVRFFIITALVLFGLAWGSHFFLRTLAYYTLPLMNTFRHSALFRLFGIFCFLMVAGFSMDEYQKSDRSKNNSIIKITTAFFALILLAGIVVAIIGRGKIFTGTQTNLSLKNSITQLNFYQRFLIQLPVVLLILLVFDLLLRRKKNFRFIILLSVFDLFLATQFNIPITVIGAKKFTEVETIMNRNKESFPLPGNNSIEENSFNSIDSTGLIVSKIPFTKKIARTDYYITPGNLALQDSFYDSPIRKRVFKNPVLYFAGTSLFENDSFDINKVTTNSFAILDTNAHADPTWPLDTFDKISSINITHFSANRIKSDIDNRSPCYVVYLQNYYPGWKAFIDNKEVPIRKANITFMAVFVTPGKHTLVFDYDPTLIRYSWYVSFVVLIATLIFLLISFLRRNNSFLSQQ